VLLVAFWVAGQLTQRLSVVIGGVYLDPEVSGDQVDFGLIGRRPVGSFTTNITSAINWNVPWLEGLSLDANFEHASDRTANSANTFIVPARYVASVGGRYRFELFDRPATYRAQMASADNAYGYSNVGEGFYYNLPRRFQMSLTVDI
jgi:iron complex outermembrane receptor protein